MSCKEWTKSIKGVDDVELGIPRTSSLTYHCAAPESGGADGLVFVIPDFGDEANGEELRNFRVYLAEQRNLFAVTVEYHCYQSRLPTGAEFALTSDELAKLVKLGAEHGLLNAGPAELMAGLAALPERHVIDMHISPANGDYQNFGVMQALDHLTVLADLLSAQADSFNQENIIAIGANHGAYIAHLISKFAPNTLRAVIDNSSYTDPVRGLHRVAPALFGNLQVNCILVNKWVADDVTSKRYFSLGRRLIRHTSLPSDIEEMGRFSQRLCQYRMIHAVDDAVEPIEEKRLQAERLKQAGFDVVLREVSSVGETIEQLADGVNASLRAVFDYFYPTLAPRPGKLDGESGNEIAYFCDEYFYSFLHAKEGCSMRIGSLRAAEPVPVMPAPKFYGQFRYGQQRIEFHGIP